MDTEEKSGHGTKFEPKDLDIKVKVGWVKGLNRLYFLYEAYDNYWDFADRDCITTCLKWWWMGTVGRAADQSLSPRYLDTPRQSAKRGRISTHEFRAPPLRSGMVFPRSARAGRLLPHIFTPPAEGEGLGNGVGLRALDQGTSLGECRAYNYNFELGPIGQAHFGVLDSRRSIKPGLRRPATRRRKRTHEEIS